MEAVQADEELRDRTLDEMKKHD